MHTVEMLEQALELARRLGYQIRQEWLGGCGGGSCEIRGQKWLFIDLALNTFEQLEQVAQALREDQALYLTEISPEMRDALGVRRAA